jgi:hypothetical protein
MYFDFGRDNILLVDDPFLCLEKVSTVTRFIAILEVAVV